MDGHTLITLLRLTSGLCWTAVYIRVVLVGARDKTCGLPFLALAANLAWEGVFGYLLDYGPSSAIQQRTNQVWFFFDVGIAYLYVRYGNPGDTFPSTQTGRSWWLGLATVALGAIMYRAAVEHGVQPAARPTAFAQNLVMSILFVDMLKRSQSARGQSVDVAVLKMIGTIAATIYLTVNTGSLLIAVLGTAIAGYDVAYVVLLARERARVPASVASRVSAATSQPSVVFH